MFVRTEEYKEQKAQFHDWYGEEEWRLGVAARIAGQPRPQTYLYVPTVPTDDITVWLEDVQGMKADGDVTYLLLARSVTLGSALLDTNEVVSVYQDEGLTELLGYRLAPNVFAMPGADARIAATGTRTAIETRVRDLYKAEFACKSSEVDAKRAELRRQAVRAFVEAASDRRLETLRVKEDDLAREHAALMARLVPAIRELEDARIALEALESNAASYKKERENDIDELLGYPSLRDVTFKDGSVVFDTIELGVKDKPPGTYRPFGEFVVTVNMDTSAVTIKNTDNRIKKGYGVIPHPHCGESGNPCLGNIAPAISEVVASYDLLGLWQLLHGFLTSYNENDSWGKRYKYWPLLDAETGEIIESPAERQEYGVCARCGWAPETEGEADEHLHECDACGDTVCYECLHYCEDDGNYYCDECEGPFCEACDTSHVPGTEMYECEHCGTYVCERHLCEAEDIDGETHFYCCEDHRDADVEENYERFHLEEEGDE